MAVAFDAKSTAATATSAAASPLTHSNMTVGSGSNRVLLATFYFSNKTRTISSVVWDAAGANQAMTLIQSQATTGTNGISYLYGLVNPVSGNKTLTITWTGGTSDVAVACASYTGADQTGGTTTFNNSSTNTGTGTTATITITTSTTDAVVAHHVNNQFGFSSANGTSIYSQSSLTGSSAGNYEVNGATATLTATWNGSDNWASVGTNIKALATIGKMPSNFLLPPRSGMIGWRGLRQLQAFPPPTAASLPVGTAAIIMAAAAIAWLPPDPGPYFNNQQPYAPEVLSPPISGPAPQNPPFPGAQIPQAVLNAWLPPDPAFQVARNLTPKLLVSDPPFAGGARVPNEVLITWVPPPPNPFMGMGGGDLEPLEQTKLPARAIANYPPPSGVYQVPQAVLIAWIPPDPAPILPPKVIESTVPNYPPPSTVYNVRTEILISWLPPDPRYQAAINLAPPSNPVPAPLAGPVTALPAVLDGWVPPDPPSQRGPFVPSSAITNYPPPSSAYQVRGEVLAWWVQSDQLPTLPAKLAPQPAVPPSYVTIGAIIPQAVFNAWLPPDPGPTLGIDLQPYQPPRLSPPQSGPPPQNPPFPGAKIPAEVQVGWLPPAPMPVAGPPLVQGAAPTPFVPSRQPGQVEIAVSWLPPPPQPVLWPPFNPFLAVSIPVPHRQPGHVELIVSWWPPDWPSQQRLLTPLSNPVPAPLAGSYISLPIRVWWETPPPPQPPTGQIQPFQTPPPANRIYALPAPVRAWWDIPPPDPIVARNVEPPIPGPAPQNPPFMGGARVLRETLIGWIPLPPQPPAGFTYFTPSPPALLRVDANFVTWPFPRVTIAATSRRAVTYPLPMTSATVLASRKSTTIGSPRVTVATPQRPGMPRGNDFSPVDPTETVTNTWDFGPWLSVGATLSAPATTCTLLSGTDATPGSRLIGTPQVTASPSTKIAGQAVLQQVSTMQAGALYELTCTATTSDGQVLTLYAHQLCAPQT